ncbi:MAG: hypothetical protein ACI33M_15420 [Lysinibacillus sp.]
MIKRILWLTTLLVAVFYITPSVLSEYSSESGEEQFLEGAIFDEVSVKFDVHAMGISKEQQILSVRTFNADLTDEIELYFKKQLILHGMKDYEIEVYADEKEGVRN